MRPCPACPRRRSPLTRYRSQPPWEFLLTASRNSLQSYELTRLSHAANLRKEIVALMDQWLEENSSAAVARWLIIQHARPAEAQEATGAAPSRSAGPEAGRNGASDNFFADAALAAPIKREVA